MTEFVARRYRYADGIAYRQNLYVLTENKLTAVRTYGGLVVLKDKALAYVGHPGLVQEKIGNVIAKAEAFAWGATPAEALAKIKPALEVAFAND
jgi:hypothetical protein